VVVQLSRKLDATYQLDTGRGGKRQRLVVTLESIVIRDAERVDARGNGFLD